MPTEVPAAISTKFIVSAYSPANLSLVEYVWDFGDNTASLTTANKSAIHAYSAIGNYTIKINVKDSSGQEASKQFTINVISPKEIANQTLTNKKKYLQNVTAKVVSFPSWQYSFIEKLLNTDDIEDKLSDLQDEYNDAETTDEYVAVMANLTNVKVPKSILTGEKGDVAFLVNKENVDLKKLKETGAGDYEETASEAYKDAIAEWFRNNVESKVGYESFSVEFDNEETTIIATLVKLNIKPKKSLDDVFLVIEKPHDENKIVFKEDYNEKSVDDAWKLARKLGKI